MDLRGGIVLLVIVDIMGHIGKGAQRWLDFGFIRFQPSELMKLAVPMLCAWYLHERPLPPNPPTLGMLALIILVPAGLTAAQPDLGTAILIAIGGGLLVIMAGLSVWYMIGAAAMAGVGAWVGWQYFLHDYQKQRVLTFFDPLVDPQGAGYHIIQSQIAIGSGGLFGKGWMHGSQSQLDYLPERHTDFIFAVIGEEFGLLGLSILLLLYSSWSHARCTCVADPGHLHAAAQRQPRVDLFRIRVHQRRHGQRPAARGRRATAAGQLWRHIDGDPAGELRYPHGALFAPQARRFLEALRHEMTPSLLRAGFAALLTLSCMAHAADAVTGLDVTRTDVKEFIAGMAQRQDFDAVALSGLLAEAQSQPRILELIQRPAERALAWWEYRQRFINEERIAGGVKVWQAHRAELARIADRSGVPAEYLVAITGVETSYGRNMGRYRVLDALATLGFDYPPRSEYFRNELEQFLLMTREDKVDPRAPLGSYAGAMGVPQFMPSSVRAYAVDDGKDGHRDLFEYGPDVFASIANYFVQHGWIPGAPVLDDINHNNAPDDPAAAKLALADTLASLHARGYIFSSTLPEDTPAMLVPAQFEQSIGWRVGYQNFYVITRYNRSTLYAMAVHELAQAIARRYRAAEAQGKQVLMRLAAMLACAALLAACGAPPKRSAPPARTQVPSPGPNVPRHHHRRAISNPYPTQCRGSSRAAPAAIRFPMKSSAGGMCCSPAPRATRSAASPHGTGRISIPAPPPAANPYDMYAMTAAHKTLPIPAYARVTNLGNGRSVVVRINDRGPFVDNRIIDLSYTAAHKLGMTQAGTAFVEVEVITPGTAGEAATGLTPVPPPPGLDAPRLYLQAGAFGVQDNATQLADRLRAAGIGNVLVRQPDATTPLYRVRVGPVRDVASFDILAAQIARLGIETRLVNE